MGPPMVQAAAEIETHGRPIAHMDDLQMICKGAISEMQTIRNGQKSDRRRLATSSGTLAICRRGSWLAAVGIFCWRERELIDFSLQMGWNQETK